MYRAIVFDMDGTLGDTLPLCVESYRRCVAECTGKSPTDADIVQYFGKSDRGVLGALLGIHPDAKELPIDRFSEIYAALHPTWAPAPFAGAIELLHHLRERGLRLALITGKEHYTATPTLRLFGMEGLFDWIGYGTPTHNCKDERLLELMREWQLSAQDILYVGDAPSDIELCHKVGVPIINAVWGTTPADDTARCLALAPEYRLTHFSELAPLIKQLTT